VYVEDHRVAGLDPNDPIRLDYSVQRGEPRSFVNGIPRIGSQTGGEAALWKDDEIADTLAGKADAFLERNKDKPFFLYLATHDIHVPRVPNARFKGTSQAGVRGDTIHSFDWTIGRVLDTLDRLKLADNTLVIVTSDNGGTLDSNGPDIEHGGTPETNNGHPHNGPLRAGKGSAYEGGTRVPFLARWPGHIQSGVSGELICHVDMLATFAALTSQALPADAAPDSFNVLPALLGERLDQPCRGHLVEHGNVLAIRQGPWKLIPGEPAGTQAKKPRKKAPRGDAELYNLAEDIGETTNVAAAHPDRVKEMSELLQRVRENGRSRP
jgi:arylsulfatase A-like enzyme